MGSFKYKLARFMSGRYGNDKLNHALLILYLVLWVLNLFIHSAILYFVIVSVMVLVILRMMSKNIYKRRQENEIYLKFSKKYLPDITLLKSRYRDRHTHIYKKCPTCKAVLRLKRIPGEHTAVCPKCKSKINIKVK